MNSVVSACTAAPFVSRLHIQPHIYQALAQKLREEIGMRDYISTSLEVEDGDLFFRFTCAAIICRGDEQWPEGVYEVVSKVVPVWWELHSFRGDVEVRNDATFEQIHEYIINQ